MIEGWDMTWPVGLLVVAIVLAIIDAIQRARSPHKVIRVITNERHGGLVARTTPVRATEDQRVDGD